MISILVQESAEARERDSSRPGAFWEWLRFHLDVWCKRAVLEILEDLQELRDDLVFLSFGLQVTHVNESLYEVSNMLSAMCILSPFFLKSLYALMQRLLRLHRRFIASSTFVTLSNQNLSTKWSWILWVRIRSWPFFLLSIRYTIWFSLIRKMSVTMK